MNRLVFLAASALLAAPMCWGQQSDEPGPPLRFDNPLAKEPVYVAGPEVTAPELASAAELAPPKEKCQRKVQGEQQLFVIVDHQGNPRDIYFISAAGNDLDKVALKVVEGDRFKPGTHGGAPAAVAITVSVKMDGCLATVKDGKQKTLHFWLRSKPVQALHLATDSPQDSLLPAIRGADEPRLYKVGGGVTAPRAIFQPEAEFTDAARSAKFGGNCVVSLVVNAEGMPENVRVVRRLGYGLDENAVSAVKRYRFRPAMTKDGPVPAAISVSVSFKIY
jgi:TonB family protein